MIGLCKSVIQPTDGVLFMLQPAGPTQLSIAHNFHVRCVDCV